MTIGTHVMTKYGDGFIFQVNDAHVWVWLRDLSASPYSSTYERIVDITIIED